jgi:hypothetical protein
MVKVSVAIRRRRSGAGGLGEQPVEVGLGRGGEVGVVDSPKISAPLRAVWAV